MKRLLAAAPAVWAALAAPSAAQYGNAWVTLTEDPSMLSAGTISDSSHETDLAWGDLDLDGMIDLVVVRKQPFTSTGKRTNVLLMNEGGVLTDRTSTYATDADVPGDQGFLTPTNDRDVVLTDVDQDGWLDVVVATTLSDGDPKHIGHPRVYRNEGGAWDGLRFEAGRTPQLYHYGTGNAQNPRFCAVAAGDVTGDGCPELYFGDYDSSGAGGAQQGSNEDLNDRLFLNDGNGFFSDVSQSRMTSTMLESAFGMAVAIEDMNLDGRNDVVKDTALNAPQNVSVSYNNLNGQAAGDGYFNAHDVFHTNAPYHTSVGDLNNDGRPDVVVSDDGDDRYRLNTGNDFLGRAEWSSARKFDFLTGGDDGFASNNLIVDLDSDGWNDVFIADVDVDIGSYSRRLHIYHNHGGTPGTTNLTLREERQSSSSSGWVGVVGMTTDDMGGTHDVAVFDIDGDCDLDLVVSRRDGTQVWRNLLDPAGCGPAPTCQTDLGYGDGQTTLSVCGGDLTPGEDAVLEVAGAPSSTTGLLFVGLQSNPAYLADLQVTLVPFPWSLAVPMTTNPAGEVKTSVPGGGPTLSLYAQYLAPAGASSTAASNGVRIDLNP